MGEEGIGEEGIGGNEGEVGEGNGQGKRGQEIGVREDGNGGNRKRKKSMIKSRERSMIKSRSKSRNKSRKRSKKKISRKKFDFPFKSLSKRKLYVKTYHMGKQLIAKKFSREKVSLKKSSGQEIINVDIKCICRFVCLWKTSHVTLPVFFIVVLFTTEFFRDLGFFRVSRLFF